MKRHRATGGEISRGTPDATITGNRKAMPSETLSRGKAEARTTGPSSKAMALGRSMGRTQGPSPARAIANGASDAVRKGPGAKEMAAGRVMGRRLKEGGSANDCFDRLTEAKKRNNTLGLPRFKKGGSLNEHMKTLYDALHGHFEKEPQMKKLGATAKNVYEGEPHHTSAKSKGDPLKNIYR